MKCQCCPHIQTSQLICCATQLTGFYMRATLALNVLITIAIAVYHYEYNFLKISQPLVWQIKKVVFNLLAFSIVIQYVLAACEDQEKPCFPIINFAF